MKTALFFGNNKQIAEERYTPFTIIQPAATSEDGHHVACGQPVEVIVIRCIYSYHSRFDWLPNGTTAIQLYASVELLSLYTFKVASLLLSYDVKRAFLKRSS